MESLEIADREVYLVLNESWLSLLNNLKLCGRPRNTRFSEADRPNSCLTSRELEGCRFHRLSCRSTELAVDVKSHSPQARSLFLSYPAAKNLELSKLLRCPRRTSNIKPADRTFPSPPGRSATGEVPDPHDRDSQQTEDTLQPRTEAPPSDSSQPEPRSAHTLKDREGLGRAMVVAGEVERLERDVESLIEHGDKRRFRVFDASQLTEEK